MRKNQAMTSPSRPHRVVVLVRHGVMPMELGIVHQLFGTATDPDHAPLYAVRTCTPTPGLVRTEADFALQVTHGLDLLDQADTVLVPASHELDETDEPLDEATGTLLARVSRPVRIASICTGAFALAHAGLLDGRAATTHWLAAEAFARRYPRVELDPNVLFTDDHSVLTSAGEASGIDLCLHLIRTDHGSTVAADVARRTIVPPYRQGGQAQYIPNPMPDSGPGTTARARAWALEHLGEPIALKDLARHESMSVRTFTRRFKAETGVSPGTWLTTQRLDRARQLLEHTDLPIDQIATTAGFGTAASLRLQLSAALGVTPTAYRATFHTPNHPSG